MKKILITIWSLSAISISLAIPRDNNINIYMRDSSNKPISVDKYELVNTGDSNKKAKYYITNNEDLSFNFEFYGLQESKLVVTAPRKSSDLYKKLVQEEVGLMNSGDYYNAHTASIYNYYIDDLENKFNFILYGNLIVNKHDSSKIKFEDIYIGQVDSTENKWFIGGKNCYSHGDYGNVSTEDCYDDSGHAYEIEIQNYGINSKKIFIREKA